MIADMVPHIFVMYHVILTQVFQLPECFTNAFERELKWTFFYVTFFFIEKFRAFVILSDEGLTLETSALKLFSGQFMLSA